MAASVSLASRICSHSCAAPEITLGINRPKASFKVETLVWKRVQARRRHPASSTPGGKGGAIAYWGVANADKAFERLVSLGATERSAVQEVGEAIRVATVFDPFGNIFGIIENPHFKG